MTYQRPCAYLTMEDTTGFYIYDHLTIEPLAQLGWRVEQIPWNRAHVCWDDYDVVVIRSPWDYQKTPLQFLSVLEHIEASRARLENPLDVVRWNLEKSYLQDLRERGVRIVPTRWLGGLDEQLLEELHGAWDVRAIVLKPVVGANADDTFRLTPPGSRRERAAALKTFATRPCMAQPFVETILTEGEYSLFYFGGRYSHAVRKVPHPGDFRVQEEHGGQIHACRADAALQAAGAAAIAAIGQELLYARVDLVRLPDGAAAVMELELIEPSLYFPYDAQSPRRFAQALHRMVGTPRPKPPASS